MVVSALQKNEVYFVISNSYSKQTSWHHYCLYITGMRRRLNPFSDHLAIDLGTASTLLYAKDRGIVINAPTAVAVGVNGHPQERILAVGGEAISMQGKTPAHMRVIRPVQDGVITDVEATCAMLKHFIKMARKRRKLAGLHVIVAVPSGITRIEMHAVIESAESAGARRVYLIEGPVAAALGADLPVTEPVCSMVVDIGDGTTEVAIISLGGIVASRSIKVAGSRMNEAIINYIKRKYDLLIGDRTAESIKITIGDACPNSQNRNTINVKGRDLTSGIPGVIPIDSEEIREAIAEQIGAIVRTVQAALEEIPPELSADVLDRGILLTGGGALLKNFEKLLTREIGLPTTLAEDPFSTVVLGAAKLLENTNGFNRFMLK
jgi:rod shape-determining protein MreB